MCVYVCVCETWSLTLREEHTLNFFENRVLRRIFGPKRNKVTGEWRRLHNEELYALYSTPNITRMIKSRKMRWAGHVVCMRARSSYRVLVEKPEGRRPLWRRRRRWEDNIKMDLREVEWRDMGWIGLAQNRDGWASVNAVVDVRFPCNAGICWLAENLTASQEGLCSVELVRCLYAPTYL